MQGFLQCLHQWSRTSKIRYYKHVAIQTTPLHSPRLLKAIPTTTTIQSTQNKTAQAPINQVPRHLKGQWNDACSTSRVAMFHSLSVYVWTRRPSFQLLLTLNSASWSTLRHSSLCQNNLQSGESVRTKGFRCSDNDANANKSSVVRRSGQCQLFAV